MSPRTTSVANVCCVVHTLEDIDESYEYLESHVKEVLVRKDRVDWTKHGSSNTHVSNRVAALIPGSAHLLLGYHVT